MISKEKIFTAIEIEEERFVLKVPVYEEFKLVFTYEFL